MCRESTAAEDAAITAVCARIAATTVAQMLGEGGQESQEVSVDTLDAVGRLLQQMEAADLPREKTALAQRAWAALSGHVNSSKSDLSMDDLLPTWLFATARARLSHLRGDLLYIKTFDLSSRLLSERPHEHSVANLEAAAQFFIAEAESGKWR